MLKKLKTILLFLVVIMMMFSIGCQTKTVTTKRIINEVDETRKNFSEIFEMELFSDKKIYKTTDKIDIWARLKYVGKNSKITIWSGDPYINFHIFNDKDFETGGMVSEGLMSTELENNRMYIFNFVKSGGYSADDPKGDFWKKFYAQKDLYLPEGKYTIKVDTGFSLSKNNLNYNEKDKNKGYLSREFDIEVERVDK